MFTLKEIAKMIDHSLLHPTMTDADLRAGCELAKKYDVASVCIKPYAVKMAAEMLAGSDVLVCTVVGFPQGSSNIDIKTAETRQACLGGATEIDMVVNIGKVLSEDWEYVEKEIAAVQNECVKHGAILKVIFENDFLPDDEHKIKLCKICGEIGAAFVKTSTGYGFVKQANGDYNYRGATEHDIKLMRANCPPVVQIKGAGGIRTLDDLLKFREWGVTRVGATATAAMLEEAKNRLGLAAVEAVAEETIGY
jgi:deoxyribose-phosphate aldolase